MTERPFRQINFGDDSTFTRRFPVDMTGPETHNTVGTVIPDLIYQGLTIGGNAAIERLTTTGEGVSTRTELGVDSTKYPSGRSIVDIVQSLDGKEARQKMRLLASPMLSSI